MKKNIRRTLGFLTALIMTVGNMTVMPAEVFAAEKQSSGISVLPVMQSLYGSDKEVAINSTLNALKASAGMGDGYYDRLDIDTSLFPSSLDLREMGLSSSTKNQGSHGTCWSFAAMASIESSLIKRNPAVDLSEWQLAYFAYTGEAAVEPSIGLDLYDEGGWSQLSINTLAQWIGPISEEQAPYECSPTLDDELRYKADYKLTDATYCSRFYEFAYYPSVDEIKYQVFNNLSACQIDFSHNDENFNYETNAYYNPTHLFANHAIVVVGWDDDYSRFNFLSNIRPKKNGAFLCRNSWDTSFGDDGYFWISYEDASITSCVAYQVTDKDDYDNLYCYDTLMWGASIAADPIESYSSYMANIFTANGNEDVVATAFYTTDNHAQYEITVYTGLEDENNPTSGKASAVTSGEIECMGYHTVDLSAPVAVAEGEKYAVVVKLTNPSVAYPIPVEAAFVYNYGELYSSECTYDKLVANTQEGQSFISLDGEGWQDTCLMYYDLTPNINMDTMQKYLDSTKKGLVASSNASADIADIIAENPDEEFYTVLGNVCLKAITNDSAKVSFSAMSGGIYPDEKISLFAVDCDSIYYSLDGEATLESTVYDGPFTLPEGGTVSAFAVKDGVAGAVETRTYTTDTAVLSSLLIKLGGEEHIAKCEDLLNDVYASSESSGLYGGIFCDNVEFVPYSCYPITVNGEPVVCGRSISLFLDYGNNPFVIKVDGGELGVHEYHININRKTLSFDYYTCSISYTDNITLTDKDGNVIENYASVEAYCGEELNVSDSYTGELYKFKVPERPEFSISDYSFVYKDSMLSVKGILSDEDFNKEATDIYVGRQSDMYDSVDIASLVTIDSIADTEAFINEMYFDEIPEEEQEKLLREYVMEHSGIPVTPGETIYIRIVGTDDTLASQVVEIQVPETPDCPFENVEIESITDNSITVKPMENAEYALYDPNYIEVQPDPEEQDNPPYGRPDALGNVEDMPSQYLALKWQDSNVFDQLSPGSGYTVYMRQKSSETQFHSADVSLDVTTTGIDTIARINFMKESVTFDPSLCAVYSPSGVKLAPNSSISSYVGKTLRVVPTDTSLEPRELVVPEREAAVELSINYNDKCTNEVLTELLYIDDVLGSRLTTSDIYLDQENHMSLYDFFGTEIVLYKPATSRSFKSEKFILSVPMVEYTPDYYSMTAKITDTEIEFMSYDANARYYICSEDGTAVEPQESPVFTGLEAGKTYSFGIYAIAGEYSFETSHIFVDITTSTEHYTCFDFTEDECMDAFKLVNAIDFSNVTYFNASFIADDETLASALLLDDMIDVSVFGVSPELAFAYVINGNEINFAVCNDGDFCIDIGRVLLSLKAFGVITVTCATDTGAEEPLVVSFNKLMIGDINLDDDVDIKDLNLLAKHIAMYSTLEGDAYLAADCNADGTVDIKDLSRLMKFVAQFDVVLG